MSIKGFNIGGQIQKYDYESLDNLPGEQGVSDDLKQALLQIAQKVAYVDDDGATYYQDLYDALYPPKTLLSIAAVFNQGSTVVYNTASLDSLKTMLTVTATYDDSSTETVASADYTLSGTLNVGTSVITATYEGKTAAFNVTVTQAPSTYSVTNALTNCTSNNGASAVVQNASYSATIMADTGYSLTGATVSITMGGTDVTSTVYNAGAISIASVTGDLAISVSAVAITLSSISAVYTQSGTVYTTDTLDSLKADLVVTATYSDSSTATVAAADYTLSGTLTAGTSTITVSYGGKTDTFTVTVTASTVLTGYTEIGTPNISGNIFTPSSNGYIKTLDVFSPGSSSWAIRFRITKGSTDTKYRNVFRSVDASNAAQKSIFAQDNQSNRRLYISSDNSNYDISNAQSISISGNTDLFWEIAFDGTDKYTAKSSSDGAEWTTVKTITSNNKVHGGEYIAFGGPNSGSDPFNGTFYLDTIKIYIDGSLWWQAKA